MAYEGSSDQELQNRRMGLEADLRRLANEHSRNRSRDDGMAGYDGLVAEAYQLVESGFEQQAAALRAIGRAGTSTTEWQLPTRFCQAQEIIRDHEGAGRLRAAVESLEFGMATAAYNEKVEAIRTEIASIRAELAFRESERAVAKAATVYSDEISRIGG